ncbi:glycoside hydrolase family 70 protein [Oenococcus sicerae]|uniref:dextransucrase n=1 Tax=Oenococcus sicerae TaxID=2203724 RepID=A0AAJ1R9G0_9LACO|nr:glycoside hydrolase family 70 protein [Oenococcus sicerae]MDN6899690.1 hydrolase [Oenococcus sicerae]
MRKTETLFRKKMYKKGKIWVVACLSSAAILSLNIQSAQADTNTNGPNTSVSTDKASAGTAITGNDSSDTEKQTAATAKTVSTDLQTNDGVQTTNSADTSNQQSETVDSVGHYVEKNGHWYYLDTSGQIVTGLQKIDGQTQYFAADGSQVKGQLVTVEEQTYYFDLNSGNAVTGLQTVNGHLIDFDNDGRESKNVYAKDDQGNNYYFDENGQMVTGLKVIDNLTYYFDQDGHQRKGFSAVFNNQVLYFDKITGASTSATVSDIKEGLTVQNDDFTQHNAANTTTIDSFTNVDGYLTAAAWYRPKDILDNGQTWRPSTVTDFRPILTSWWPDKQTQVNYLNYMKNQGFISKIDDFKTTDDQTFLNQSAQAVQSEIEKKISLEKSTDWLKTIMQTFVDQQPAWNSSSEDPNTDHLQGGALTYINSPLTPDANSNFRLLNRTPTNQTGTPEYTTDNSLGGFELLLANDVDNSNPVVQAEQLNWLYYLMNFGSITNNDADANFDGIRIDAVDNVDADLLQIAADYFKDAYGVDKNDATADQHLSILEDWSHNDPTYVTDNGSNQLTMDDYLHTQLIWSLTKSSDIRGTMQRFMDYYLVNRASDSTEDTATPNYSFVRAHDSEVQTVIAQIISDLYPNSGSGLIPTQEEMDAAFKVYNADMQSADKKYTQYNIPSAYAMLLTNKDTVPRVYYGDLYTDNGQYMATQSPYFDAIDNLLKSRIKYVAGGQSMAVDNHDILTSVRYGQDALTAEDSGSSATRTQGIGVIVSNNASLKLTTNDQVVLHMGAAHKNQAFRAALLTTLNGLISYQSDDGAPVKYTDANGDLIFNASDIFGVQNSQVSGYLAVWVPVGASSDQDARTQADDEASTDGKVLHSNAALDSQVIYEGFSNFQATPTTHDEYTNVVIAKNADTFKDWGITSFQLAPQYRSSTDQSFLDSIIQNGYAFTDRYDLGFDTPTKYGTVDDLRDAIKALHADGLQAIADWVPDQIYNLQDAQVVTVDRTNSYGQEDDDSDMQNDLYVSQTKGGGKYQEQFGGAFLGTLQNLYPDLFTDKQLSTGLAIDPSQKITEWSAKHFNGSNIQGRGAYYVLRDNNDQYFRVTSNDQDEDFLPKQLTNQISETGFIKDDQGMTYYSTSGYEAKNSFIQDDNGNYYYFDNSGHMVTGQQTINNHVYFFLPNGVELQNVFLQDADGNTYYYNDKGRRATNTYITDQNNNSYRFDENGIMLSNQLAVIDGHTQFFKTSGIQVKNAFIKDNDGNLRYFESGNGNMVTNEFKQLPSGEWAYLANDGIAVKGLQTIDGRQLYFDNDGQQNKDIFYTDENGQRLYFNGTTGDLVKNDFIYSSSSPYADIPNSENNSYSGNPNHWYYADDQGHIVTGFQTINGHLQYFDKISGQMQVDQFAREDNGNWVYLNENGEAVQGLTLINGKLNFFNHDFTQVKNNFATDPKTGISYYFNGTSGKIVENDYFTNNGTDWYHADENGQKQTGFQTINGQVQYFDKNGIQLKNGSAYNPQSKQWFYFDANKGNGSVIS